MRIYFKYTKDYLRLLSRKRFALLFAVLFAHLHQANCQLFENVVGPSPNAASFSKYGEVPVNIYTGVPNIEIPLYTIKSGGLQIPVSLSYHAGGFRVDEEAGRTGLGWTLNAGGVISRTVNGIDDFSPVKGYYNNSFPEFISSSATGILQSGQSYLESTTTGNYIINVVGNSTNMNAFLPTSVSSDVPYDTEPDVYTYNFAGFSGKFSLKKNGDVVKQKPDGVDIKLLNIDGSSWQITTPDGVRFIFNRTERCSFQSPNGYTGIYTTSWYLTEIVSTKGDQITFGYSEIAGSVINYNNINERYTLEVVKLYGLDSALPQPGELSSSNPPIKNYNAVFLSSITFPHGIIEFEYQAREDLQGDKRLVKMDVTNTSDARYNFSYEFKQNYFVSSSTGFTMPNPLPNLNPNLFSKRLRLDSLIKTNANGAASETHHFVYESTNLPYKNSYARDHWGFYNGKTTNRTLLPNMQFLSNQHPGTQLSYSGGANRDGSGTHVKAAMLKEIVYPTGGRTVFEFESNDYEPVISNSNGGGYIKTATLPYFTRRGTDDTLSLTIPEILPFTKVKFNIKSEGGQTTGLPFTNAHDAMFAIYSVDDLTTPVVQTFLGFESFWTRESGFTDYRCYRNDQFELPEGEYIVITHIASHVMFLNYVRFSFEYSYYADATTGQNPITIGGGARIAKISDVDALNNVNETRFLTIII
ncbi:hypothetical protein ACFOET_11195 [Parapedobacter deserti]|uniref:YD repeat-containing protein n=1 Tax=Parapedobacter deserti TaxID=1912957 RepID=A0ABV7JMV2_9SPHI